MAPRRLIKGESPELAGIWVVIEVVPPAISMMPVWVNAHGHRDVVYWKTTRLLFPSRRCTPSPSPLSSTHVQLEKNCNLSRPRASLSYRCLAKDVTFEAIKYGNFT